ncbi:hypothetical protein M422DRAFT_245495 [Sphaerobolus stellatus SS14]|nr:hypothetical protein M422DRAFT_245495 [Sphaerobolus stellatus SS14]
MSRAPLRQIALTQLGRQTQSKQKKTLGPVNNTQPVNTGPSMRSSESDKRGSRSKPSARGQAYQKELELEMQKRKHRQQKIALTKERKAAAILANDLPSLSDRQSKTTKSSASTTRPQTQEMDEMWSIQGMDERRENYGRESNLVHGASLRWVRAQSARDDDLYSNAEPQEEEEEPDMNGRMSDQSADNEEGIEETVPLQRDLPEEFIYNRITQFPPRTSSVTRSSSPARSSSLRRSSDESISVGFKRKERSSTDALSHRSRNASSEVMERIDDSEEATVNLANPQ